MLRGLRAIRRTILAAGMAFVLLPLVALQAFIVGPLLKNNTAIPSLFYSSLRQLFGIKIEFNKSSAPIENKKPTWFVANHMSMADFLILGGIVKGSFAGKGEILRTPGVAQIAKAAQFIGISRVSKKDPDFQKYHKMAIGKIAGNFNDGNNTIMFPEGTATDGSKVAQFRAGLISVLFGTVGTDKQGNDVPLKKDVVVQPIAIRVKDVEGKDIKTREDLRRFYCHPDTRSTLKRIWIRFATKSTTIELTVFSPMNPRDYKDQFDLINEAGDLVRAVVAPAQTIVEPARIPNVD